MKKTIFKRPLFVNPQAYTVIPELYSIDKLLSFNFDENDTYTTKLVYNGRIESIIKKAGEEYILHLDLYTVDGSCVLGEWYVKGIDSESVVTIDKSILTIVANNNLKYPGLIAAWSAKGKTNEDVDRNILKDLTGNGHDITLNNFAYSEMSGYGGYATNFTKTVYLDKDGCFDLITYNKFHYIKVVQGSGDIWDIVFTKNGKVTFKATGTANKNLRFGSYDNNIWYPIKDGFNEIEINTTASYLFLSNVIGPCDITIEILPEYPDALVFDGVDDYGVNESLPSLTDYTVISKIYWITSPNAAVYAYGKSASKDNPNYTVFSSYSSTGREISYLYNFGHDNDVKPYINPIINYHNTKVFNEIPIKKGSVIDDNYPLHLGKIWENHKGLCNMAFYSFYLFNRTLTDEEIKSFIRKHIDPKYLLPSEIQTTLILDLGKLNINELK